MKLRAAQWLAVGGGAVGCLIAVAAAPAAPAAATTTTYTMTDLGALGSSGVSRGFGINAAGEVTGQSYTNQTITFPCGRHICRATTSDPFSWIAGKLTDLGTLGAPGSFSQGRAVNRAGDIAGGSAGEAFLVHNGKMTDLGPGTATGINDFGEIAGGTSCCHAFVISGRTRTTLPDLSSYGGGLSSASGISNNHQIVGSSDNASGYSHAVLWSNGTITDLGTLGGTQSAAYAINDLGPFGLDPVGEAINNHGVIVGQSGNGAWIWSGGTFQNLNNLIPAGSGFILDDATAINDNGQIVANGHNSTGQEHAFLLTPG
jgi:probable HAF family extracellular repeat protein